MTEQYKFTRAEVCTMLGLTRRAVGYYESLELIAPIGRGRDKRYSRREIARMKLILRGRRYGMSLEEIRRWLNLYGEQGKTPQLEAWLGIADTRLNALLADQDDLAQRISELRTQRDEVARMLLQEGASSDAKALPMRVKPQCSRPIDGAITSAIDAPCP